MKKEIVDIVMSLVVVLLAYLSFNYFNPSIEEIFLAVIFILVLILLKQK